MITPYGKPTNGGYPSARQLFCWRPVLTCFYQLANLFRREFSRTIINAGTKIGDGKYVEGIAATFRRNLLLTQSVNELSQ